MLSFELPQFIIQNYLYEGCNFSLALFIEELLKDAKIYEINQGIQNYYFIKYKNVYIDIIGIYDSEDEFLNRYQFPSKYNSNPELIEKYGIDSNKGYGAKKHIDGIKEHGITIWHRKTFGICKTFT